MSRDPTPVELFQERAALRGMPLRDYVLWRNAVRDGYRKTFASQGRPPASWLGIGGLWMLLDAGAPKYEQLAVVSELPTVRGECLDVGPTIPTWPSWAAHEISWRMRMPDEVPT